MYLDMQWHIGIIEQKCLWLLWKSVCWKWILVLAHLHTNTQVKQCLPDDIASWLNTMLLSLLLLWGVTNDTMILVMVMSIWIWLIESWKSPSSHSVYSRISFASLCYLSLRYCHFSFFPSSFPFSFLYILFIHSIISLPHCSYYYAVHA